MRSKYKLKFILVKFTAGVRGRSQKRECGNFYQGTVLKLKKMFKYFI